MTFFIGKQINFDRAQKIHFTQSNTKGAKNAKNTFVYGGLFKTRRALEPE
jgi:hypothetical protein